MKCAICEGKIDGAYYECWDCDRDVCAACVTYAGICAVCDAAEPDAEMARGQVDTCFFCCQLDCHNECLEKESEAA